MMRYDLDKEFFVGTQIFLVPLILLFMWGDILVFSNFEFSIVHIVGTLFIIAFTLLFVFILIYFWRISSKKKHYILLKDNEIEILYSENIEDKKTILLNLQYEQIKRFEYYCIAMFWLSLLSQCNCVRSLYISYDDGNELKEPIHIGYIKYKDIRNICKSLNIPLKVHHLI